MTVSYNDRVATSNFAVFLRLLLRWRGSIYKLIWKDFAAFAAIYYIICFMYHFGLTDGGKKRFAAVAVYCQQFNNLIPLAFILGFYVSLVVTRFKEQLNSLPWPSRMSVFVSTLVQGTDEHARKLRRTIVRYLSLAYVLTMRAFCVPVKKNYPTWQHIIKAGIVTEEEQESLEALEKKNITKNVYFIPLIWAAGLVTCARREGKIKDDFAVKTLIDEINDYRGKCGSLTMFDWISVPLVYTQVVTIAVYTFFISCLVGRQPIESLRHEDVYVEMFFPVFTFLEFFFYMGWLKVAETLLNPFGEDDDDFEINELVESNLKVSYLTVDDMYDSLPTMAEDKYWHLETTNINLPYTKAAESSRKSEFSGSAANLHIPKEAQEIAVMPTIDEGSDCEKQPEVSRSMSVTDGGVRIKRVGSKSLIGRGRAGRPKKAVTPVSSFGNRESVSQHEMLPLRPNLSPSVGKTSARHYDEDETQFQMSDIGSPGPGSVSRGVVDDHSVGRYVDDDDDVVDIIRDQPIAPSSVTTLVDFHDRAGTSPTVTAEPSLRDRVLKDLQLLRQMSTSGVPKFGSLY